MKKYMKPAVEVEKFTVADVITDSAPVEETTTTVNKDHDIGELSVALDVNDEF